MDGCTDKRFAARRHHYELGLMGDDERREFELHLLECEACFESVQRFRKAAWHIRHNPKVRDVIGQTAADVGIDAEMRPAERRKAGRLIPAFILAAAALFLLILKPWHVEFQTDYEAVAAENRLAIMVFDNLADPADSLSLGPVIADLLITDLSASHFMQVISSQHLKDIDRLLRRSAPYDSLANPAARIAEKAEARWMLTGSIVSDKPDMALTCQLVDMESGLAVASVQITGEPEEDIFALADRLSAEVKSKLALPPAAQQELDRDVAEVTTYSPEAYRNYVEGRAYYSKYYFREAADRFEQAVAYDSTFAMAYYYLALVKNAAYLDKAVQFSQQAGDKERLYIASMKANFDGDIPTAIVYLEKLVERFPDEKEAHLRIGHMLYGQGRPGEAIDYYKRAITVDSLYKNAYNALAYAYNAIDDYEKAILAINTYINMVPDEANPYDTRGELYAGGGEIDKAMASFRKALEIKPDFYSSIVSLGYLHMQRREYDVAEDYFRRMTASEYQSVQSEGRYYLGIIPIHQGQFQTALNTFDSIIVLEEGLDLHESHIAYKHRIKAFILRTAGRLPEALEEFEACLEIRRRVFPGRVNFRHFYAQFLAENDLIEQAEAVADELKADIEKAEGNMAPYRYALGAIAEAKGNLEAALVHYAQAADLSADFPYHFMLAKVSLSVNNLGDAVREFEELARNLSLWRLSLCMWDVKLHYYLGQAYEESRWHDKAITEYEMFLNIWSETDSEIPETADARRRLARLKSGS